MFNISYHTGKPYYNWGYNFNTHIEAYWVASGKIIARPNGMGLVPDDCKFIATFGDYDLGCKSGYGRTKEEAIEELLIAMEG